MPLPRPRVVVPVVLLIVIAGALVLLGRQGVLPIPGLAARAEDQVSADSTGAASDDAHQKDGDKKSKKKKKKGDKDEPAEEVPVPVELARAGNRPLAAYYRASSVLEADRQVELVTKTQGRVHNLLVEEGDWVKTGQVLVELENEREQVALRQAELKLGDETREFERRKTLLEKSLVTQEEYDAAKGRFELATTDRDLSRISLEETILRAPFDGQVSDRRVVPGQHVLAATPVLTLVDFEPLRVRVHLPEGIARRVREGDEVLVSVESQEAPLQAIVERISPVVDPQSSTVRLTLLVKNARGLALVGGFVKVRITTDTKTETLAVPKLALVEEGGLKSVFLAEADTVRKVEVVTGLADEEAIEILEGLAEKDLVVTKGQGGLRSGSKIDVLNASVVGWVPPPRDSTKTELADADDKKKKKKKSGK